MELAELKVFLTVAAERSFSRAAAKLYRTQPAVSQAVRRLEEQLGEQLFDRTTKSATLTEAGVVLVREGTRLMRAAEEAAAAVKRQSERGRAIVRVGASECAAHVVLPSISAFLCQRPDMSVDVHTLSETTIVAEVMDGVLDVGVVIEERIPSGLAQLVIPVTDHRLMTIVREHTCWRHDGKCLSMRLQATSSPRPLTAIYRPDGSLSENAMRLLDIMRDVDAERART